MDEKPDQRFPWSILFFVSGLCLLAFSFMMSLLDGGHIAIFLKLGPLLIGLSVIALLNKWLSKKLIKKGKPNSETSGRIPKSEDYLSVQ